jgi:hypothetical protein
MHKNAMKCNKNQSKWCKNKHGASKIIDAFEMYQPVISQHVGQLRGRLEGFCAFHLKLWDFFALLLLKPKSDRISLRGGMVNPPSAKGWT